MVEDTTAVAALRFDSRPVTPDQLDALIDRHGLAALSRVTVLDAEGGVHSVDIDAVEPVDADDGLDGRVTAVTTLVLEGTTVLITRVHHRRPRNMDSAAGASAPGS